MMKAMLWAPVVALALAYAGWGIEMAFPFLVIASALAFYHHGQVAGAAAVAATVILAGFLFAMGMRQYAFGISEASLGMLIAATIIAAWRWRMRGGGEDQADGLWGEREERRRRTKRKRTGLHAGELDG